jgi:hypothetical protein
MVHALGYSSTPFSLHDPGRLCRGRERWIEPWPPEGEPAAMHRLVVTGASFSDDSASDALRGLPHSGFDIPALLTTLFGRKPFIAFMEDGHPADIPEDAKGVELYSGHRAGGRAATLMVRWHKPVSGLRELREVLGDDPAQDRVRGFLVLDGEPPDPAALQDKVFLLVGMSTLDSPPARFQPAALPELLEVARAVVLVHRDKHGPALGVYSREPLRAEPKLAAMCLKDDVLFVRFAIPPMLARWDRALAELRETWSTLSDAPFPVPASERPSTWEPRRRRRKGPRDRFAAEVEGVEDAPEASGEDDALDGLLLTDDELLLAEDDLDADLAETDDDDADGDDGDDDDADRDDGDDGDDDEDDEDDEDDDLDADFEIDRDDADNWRDEDAPEDEDALEDGEDGGDDEG